MVVPAAGSASVVAPSPGNAADILPDQWPHRINWLGASREGNSRRRAEREKTRVCLGSTRFWSIGALPDLAPHFAATPPIVVDAGCSPDSTICGGRGGTEFPRPRRRGTSA